jgi:hypothetical protein
VGLPQDRAVEQTQARRLDAGQAGDCVIGRADGRRQAAAQDEPEHGPVVLPDPLADVHQAGQHLRERPGLLVQQQAAVVQGVVPEDADNEEPACARPDP